MSQMPSSTPPSERPASSLGLLIVVWLIVGVPASWGVSKTVQTSLKLFNPPAAVDHAVPATTSRP